MEDYVSREEVINITAETGAWETQNRVRELPAADVQPVKHGRWIVSNTQKHVEVTYECSECQHEVVGEYEKTPFCGGCGARMGGENDG